MTEIVVIGGGAMGSAAAWHLARRGREVTLLERFEPGHVRGASHGATRNFNIAYAEPDYLDMLRESLAWWRELEQDSGTGLLSLHGLVNHGGGTDWARLHASLRAAGWDSVLLSAAEARERWPGMRFEDEVHFTRDAGTVRADDAVAALQAGFVRAGGSLRHLTAVTEITEDDDGVSIAAEGPEGPVRVRARVVVVTVGAWTTKLLGRHLPLPALRVTQEQPAHFQPRHAATPWPSFNHAPGAELELRANVYGMPTPGEGVKVGWHGAGPVVDPDARDFLPDLRVQADLRRYTQQWFPGLDPETAVPMNCTYTWTDDDDFLLDRRGRIVVGAGFSGHGFKFTPSVGRILADLATDGRAPARFRLHRSPSGPQTSWRRR